MGKTRKEINEALPNLKSEKVEVLSDELDRILAIKTLFESDGGKQLIRILTDNCATALRKAIVAAKSGEEKLLTCLILDYAANIDLLATSRDMSTEKIIREQLDEAVKEAFEG